MTGSASGSGGSGGSGAGSRGAGASGTSAGSSGSGSTSTACAACKYQRRKCTPDCPLSPYFPPDQPKRFQNVHKLFGVSNILRILKHVDPSKREDTVKSISYEADTREKDPVHGCLGVITILQNQVYKLKDELAVAREQLFLLQQQQQNFNQQAQMPPIVSSLAASTSIVNVSAAQETNVLMQNFQSYNDMTEFAKSNPLPISSFEPDQFLRNDGFDQSKPGGATGAASTSRFDVGRYIRGASRGHPQSTAPLPGAVKQEPPLELHRRLRSSSSMHYGNHNQIRQDIEQPFDTAVDPFAMAIRRRGSSGVFNLTVASEVDLRRAAGGHHGVSELELRSAGVYLTLTNN